MARGRKSRSGLPRSVRRLAEGKFQAWAMIGGKRCYYTMNPIYWMVTFAQERHWMTNPDDGSPPSLGDAADKGRMRRALSRRLQEAAERSGISPKDAGKAAGVSAQTILNWQNEESSFTPKAHELATLCRLYRVSADWLLRPAPISGEETDDSAAYMFDHEVYRRRMRSLDLSDDCWSESAWMVLDRGAFAIYTQEQMDKLYQDMKKRRQSLEDASDSTDS